jgi:UDP-N-acetylmuramoyl-tripeptide--D-alanyl-D-alanine ligase
LAAVDKVFGCGAWTKSLFDSVPASKQGAYASDAATLAPVVKAALRAGDTVLVKGSYGSRMRDIISLLESPA